MNQYLNQNWTSGEGTSIPLTNPCTGEVGAQLHAASLDQADLAIQSARASSASWAAVSLDEKIIILRRYAELLEANQDKIAQSISADTGKPIWEAKTEAGAMKGKIEISIKAQETRCAEFGTGASTTRFRPHGVVVVLGPFNFPGHLPNGHIVPALLAGNIIVFKPSELTPRTGTLIVEFLLEAGLPPSVIQLIHGDGNVGAHLSGHEGIDAIFFTGSSSTGKRIAAANIHRPGMMIALEMGGNNPLVISQIDQIEAACLTIVQSAFITAGQRCTCARRLVVIENENSDVLISRLIEMTRSIQVGSPSDDPAPFMGPVISPAAAKEILAAQQKLLARGAEPLLESRLLKEDTAFISPGILDVSNVSGCRDEEIFGPLLQLIRVPDFDAAISEANHTSYGLAAGLLSSDAQEYTRFQNEVHAGLINWNQQLTGASSAAPFGGIGDSGNHRPSAYFAADYCSHPVASMESSELNLPAATPPGISIKSEG